MRLGFTGTRRLAPPYYRSVGDWVRSLCTDDAEFTTGACIGFDAYVCGFLHMTYPENIHRLIVPGDRSRVDFSNLSRFVSEQHVGWTTVEFMPQGSAYRERNERILDHSDALVAVADAPEDHPQSQRSGTWMTVRIARRRGLPVHTLVLSELT